MGKGHLCFQQPSIQHSSAESFTALAQLILWNAPAAHQVANVPKLRQTTWPWMAMINPFFRFRLAATTRIGCTFGIFQVPRCSLGLCRLLQFGPLVNCAIANKLRNSQISWKRADWLLCMNSCGRIVRNRSKFKTSALDSCQNESSQQIYVVD